MPEWMSWRTNEGGGVMMSPRKYLKGHGAEVALWLKDGEHTRGLAKTGIHGLFGWDDPKRMRFDEIEVARARPELQRGVRQGEIVGALTTLHWLTLAPVAVYTGSCQASPVMRRLWDGASGRLDGELVRYVDRCLAPLIQLAETVPVEVIVDAACESPVGSMDHAVIEYMRVHRGFKIGIESRLGWKAQWANRPEYEVYCEHDFYFNSEGAPWCIPEWKLAKTPWLICSSPQQAAAALSRGYRVAKSYALAYEGQTPAR